MANSAQKSIIVLMGERFDVLRVEFGPAGRANELSLEDFRLLSDRDANVLVERIDDFLVKAELLRMRGNHVDSGTNLLYRFSSFILFTDLTILCIIEFFLFCSYTFLNNSSTFSFSIPIAKSFSSSVLRPYD